VGNHVTTIRHTEYRKYEKPGPNSNCWILLATSGVARGVPWAPGGTLWGAELC